MVYAQDYVNRLRQAMASSPAQFPSDYIALCCAYAENLLKRRLPVLFDREHIRTVLGMSGARPCDYHAFSIPKRDGGSRVITAPSRKLKLRQQWIYRNLLIPAPPAPHVHGFVPKRSIVTNASRHIGYPYTLCVDIEDFFPSIRQEQVFQVFREMGYSASAAGSLSDLCCCAGVLPQGAPTSPQLSNLVCRSLDGDLAAMAERFQCVYTRYADDISISSETALPQLPVQLERILAAHGFSVNRGKCRLYGPGQPKHITGLVVQDRVRVPKAFKRKLRQEIHYCRTLGVTPHLENTEPARSIHYREHLYGKAYFVKMVEPELGARFLEELSQVHWPE